jgi:hypothetical protein
MDHLEKLSREESELDRELAELNVEEAKLKSTLH